MLGDMVSRLRSALSKRNSKHREQELRKRRTCRRALVAGCFERLESREMMTVTYHGGALLQHVEAQAVFMGADWSSNSSLYSQASSLNSYVGYLVNSPYMDMLTNAGYNVGRGSATSGKILNLSL